MALGVPKLSRMLSRVRSVAMAVGSSRTVAACSGLPAVRGQDLPPASDQKPGSSRACSDMTREIGVPVEVKGQEGHIVKLGSVQIGALGVDDGLAGVAALPQPEPAIGHRQHRTAACMTGGQRVIKLGGGRHDRVQHPHGQDADQQCTGDRRQQENKPRPPRRPHDDQFGRPGKAQKQPDGRQAPASAAASDRSTMAHWSAPGPALGQLIRDRKSGATPRQGRSSP